jgi:hypothetical protein
MNSPTATTAATSCDAVLDAVLAFAAALDRYSSGDDADADWHTLIATKDRLRQVAIQHVEPKRDVEPDLFADVRLWLQCDDEQTTCFMLMDAAGNRELPHGDIRRLCDAVEADLRDAEAGFLRRLSARSLN